MHICWNTFVEDFDCDGVAMVVGFIHSSKATTPELFVVVDDDIERCYYILIRSRGEES